MTLPRLTEDLYVLNLMQSNDKELEYKFKRSTIVRTKDILFSYNKEFADIAAVITIKKNQPIIQEQGHLARMFFNKLLQKYKRSSQGQTIDKHGNNLYTSWFRGKGCDFFGEDSLKHAFTLRFFMTPFSYF